MSEHGNDYAEVADVPPLVAEAAALARRMRFGNSCAVAYGRLLHTLAGLFPGGRIGETGTGCGVGTAWMLTGSAPGTTIVTVEADDARAAAAAELFASHDAVVTLHGDWTELAAHGPFDLLFPDGGGKRESQDVALEMVRPGGLLVLDDLTPGRPGPDPLREHWLGWDAVRAVEVTLTPQHAAILAVRR